MNLAQKIRITHSDYPATVLPWMDVITKCREGAAHWFIPRATLLKVERDLEQDVIITIHQEDFKIQFENMNEQYDL